MRLLILGATGGTGRELTRLTLAAGHDVAVFVRDPRAFEASADLQIVQGDALDAAAVSEAIRGRTAVVSALGTRPWAHIDICSQGVNNTVNAMREHGVKRLVAMSSWGVGDSRQHAAWFERLTFSVMLKRALADKERMEAILRNSDLDWTVVRPVGLTGGKARGGCRAVLDGQIGSHFVSRADVASFMLEELERCEYLRQTPALSY